MPDGEDYVWAPILEGLCLYESVIEGRLDLADIARMNDALEVKWENEGRLRKAMEAKQ